MMNYFSIRPYRAQKSFTLVELLIVIGIIALLATIAIPNFLRIRIDVNDAYAQATLKTIAAALENYAANNAAYPTNPGDLLGVTPPYLNEDYFAGAHAGFTFAPALASDTYTVVATPVSTYSGSRSFTITTGAVLQ